MKREDLRKYKLPKETGIYFFKKGREILYIGKATNLNSRIKSYFSGDLMSKRGVIVVEMIERADKIKLIKTDSALEALIWEAILIKKYQPKYNTKEKSDKSHNYIVITKEDFPRVLVERGSALKVKKERYMEVFGPFPQGGILRDALKIIRKIFPFRDTCAPYSKKPCFNRQIGLCPGVCMGEISKREYRQIITNIKMFLGGKKISLIKKLERQMRATAKEKKFERAGELKKQIFALRHIQDVAILKSSPGGTLARGRIEGYDVAHLSGEGVLGVMVVVEEGEPNKKEYRKFKIKNVAKANDIASLEEVVKRRLAHAEWKYPKLIVVDGGVAQKNIAEKVLKEAREKIPVVAVVKDERHKPKNILGKKELVNKYKKEILLANAEAHRFSLAGHRKIMRKSALL